MNRLDWATGILLIGMVLPLICVAGSHGTGNPDFNTDKSTLVAIMVKLCVLSLTLVAKSMLLNHIQFFMEC